MEIKKFMDMTDTNSGHIYLLLSLTVVGIIVAGFGLFFGEKTRLLYEMGRSLFDGALATLWYAMKSGNKALVP
jgi:hypothetical protein